MSSLEACAVIEGDAASAAIERLLDDEEAESIVRTDGDHAVLHSPYGMVTLALEAERLRIKATASDETNLAYLKMGLAGRLVSTPGTGAVLRWTGNGSGDVVPVFFRELRVISSVRVGPHIQRLRFAGERLERFATGGLHVRLLMPREGRKPVWPRVGEDGLLVWPQGEDALTVRVYTIRAIDVEASWVEVDFVLHPGCETPAARFAEQATPGDVIGMIGPGGGDVPETANMLLLGDDTAVPAIVRILNELRPGTWADVVIEVDGPEDVQPLAVAAGSVRWLFRDGRAPGTAGLLSGHLRHIDAAELPDDIFVWAGCEFSDFREIRQILRKRWGLPKERQLVVPYWRRGSAGDEARHEAA